MATRSTHARAALDAFRSRQDAATHRPSVPSFCNEASLPDLTLPKPGSKKFRRAPKNLQPDELVVSMMPAPKGVVLNQEQKTQIMRYFLERFDPIYAHYPVKVRHVCTRKGPMGHCYNRQSDSGKPHHEPDHALQAGKNDAQGVDPISPYYPSEYAGKNADNIAHHWISIFSLLRDWQKLPYGWVNVAGREVFFWCPVPNAHSHYTYVDIDGRTPFTDRRVPSDPIVKYSTKVFMDALKQVSASTVDWNEQWYLSPDGPVEKAVPPLIYIDDQWPDARTGWSKYVFDRPKIERAMAKYRAAAERAKAAGQPPPDPSTSKDDGVRYYAHVFGGILGLLNYAVDQNKTLRTWTLFKEWWTAGPAATVINGTERAKQKESAAAEKTNAGSSAVAAADQAAGLPGLVRTAVDSEPDPIQQMSIVEQNEAQLMQLMQAIQSAPAAAQALAIPLPAYRINQGSIGGIALYDGLQRTKVDGYEGGKERLLLPHLICHVSKQAVNLNHTYGPVYAGMVSESEDALKAWASWAPQAQAAMQAYADALQELEKIKATINLPWYLKKLGPLPTWGWMALGASGFLGTAVAVRVRRGHKKKPVTSNRRRRTSRRR